jgi:prenyltransferase beta subunit
MNGIHLINPTPIRRYLCEKTQHNIAGGFGKLPGDPPDIYHSYLGLAALALLDVGYAGEEGVLARDTGSSSSSVSEASDAEDDPRDFNTTSSLAQQRMTGEREDRHEGLRRGIESRNSENDPNRRTNGRIIRRSRLGDIKIQSVKEDFAHKDGAGEGGEVGDGGGVLRRLDPALCMSVRAREWLEGLTWRRAIVGEPPEKTLWEAPNYLAKKQDWEWDE